MILIDSTRINQIIKLYKKIVKISFIYSFVHGSGSTANGLHTVVLGGGISGTGVNTVYVPDIVIKKSAAIPTSSADAVGEDGSVTWDNTYLYWKANGQWLRLSGITF